jgi:hypothetical protein
MRNEKPRGAWIDYVAGALAVLLILFGLRGLMTVGFSLWYTFLDVSGLLLAGWALLDFRRFRSGTPESEVDGGRTIE